MSRKVDVQYCNIEVIFIVLLWQKTNNIRYRYTITVMISLHIVIEPLPDV